MKKSVLNKIQTPPKSDRKRDKSTLLRTKELGQTGAKARAALLKVATQLFAKKGLKGTSIRDIAQGAQLNSSMISYYFGSKENLYKECLRQIGDDRFSKAKDILKPPKTKAEYKERLKCFIDNIFLLFLDERDAGLIIVREFDRIQSPAGSVFKKGFLNVFDLLVDFFSASQKAKLIKRDLDAFMLAGVVFGTISNQMRMDHIIKKNYGLSLRDPDVRDRIKNQLVDLLIA